MWFLVSYFTMEPKLRVGIFVFSTVLEIRIRSRLAVFWKIGYFYGLLITVPLKMYRKYGRPKWILVSQTLKLVGKWPMADCYF